LLKQHSFPDPLRKITKAVVTVGTFDGVHRGHRSILQRLRLLADNSGGETVIITFDPHPRIALGKDSDKLKLLNTPDEKAALLEAAGIDHMVVIPFTKEFSRMSEHDFIRDVLVKAVGTETLVIGYNHRFGHDRGGDFNSLSAYGLQYGFRVEEMPQEKVKGLGVSSTQIRNALESGEIEKANAMLGYEYPLEGLVVQGDQRGRQLGFPTANILVDFPYKQIPANGVYAVRVEFMGSKYGGMCNIGYRPTFRGTTCSIEVNIFNFSGDLYQKPIKIRFAGQLRKEKAFDSLEALKEQLSKDKDAAHLILDR
jgi:riboflavin kinase/FMN adenylyltransferase